jgi:hypothetical protein
MQLLICFRPFKLIKHKWSLCFFFRKKERSQRIPILLINQTLGDSGILILWSVCMVDVVTLETSHPSDHQGSMQLDIWQKLYNVENTIWYSNKRPDGVYRVMDLIYIFQALMGQWKSHYSTRTSVASSLHHCNGKTSTFRPLLLKLLLGFDPSGRGTMQFSSSRALGGL